MIKETALKDLRRFDHLINYMYLPPLETEESDVSIPASVAFLYMPVTLHHAFLEGSRVSQLAYRGAQQLQRKARLVLLWLARRRARRLRPTDGLIEGIDPRGSAWDNRALAMSGARFSRTRSPGKPAEEIVERDDGFVMAFDAAYLLAPFQKWDDAEERRAMRFVRGRVLDVAAASAAFAFTFKSAASRSSASTPRQERSPPAGGAC